MSGLFPEDAGAEFSPCGQYRYRLWRRWDDGPTALFLMLNPSTADETANDPTVERCQRRAVKMGYGALRVCNIFALRSTDPTALFQAADPVGPENDRAIRDEAQAAELVVCGWGNFGRLYNRGREVLALLVELGVRPHALTLTQAREPGHPLYVPYWVKPRPIRWTFAGGTEQLEVNHDE